MKQFFSIKTIAIATATLVLAGSSMAQTPGTTSPGMDAVLLKLYGENKAFTALTVISISDPTSTQTMTLPVTTIQLDGNIRSETDMEKMTGGNFPPGALDQLKALGMTKVVSVVRPATKEIMLIYPGLSSYIQTPMPKEQADALSKEPKMVQTEIGKETVEGHPSVKTKITSTDAGGKSQDILVWKATDMKNFPVKIQIKTETGGEVVIVYKSVKFDKPDAKLFNTPVGYTKYATQQELLQKAASGAQP